MPLCHSQWLSHPLTKSLFSKFLPTTTYASSFFPRRVPIFCFHSSSHSTKGTFSHVYLPPHFCKCYWFGFLWVAKWVKSVFVLVYCYLGFSLTWLCKLFCEDGAMEHVFDNNNNFDEPKVKILKQKMEPLGINLDNSCLPGKYHNLFCPKVSTFIFFHKIGIQFLY